MSAVHAEAGKSTTGNQKVESSARLRRARRWGFVSAEVLMGLILARMKLAQCGDPISISIE